MSSAAAGSLRLRLLAGTLVWVLLTVVVAGWALGRLFDEHVDRQFRVELRMHLAQLAAQLMIDAEGRPALRTPLSPHARRAADTALPPLQGFARLQA